MEITPASNRLGVTSREVIEEVAFALFREHGYEGTTMAAIADRVIIGRRTLFRYFASKHDIAWGHIDEALDRFRDLVAEHAARDPLHQAVLDAVLAFHEEVIASDPHGRFRMRLILSEPTLQAHSVLRYASWRSAIAEQVAARRGLKPWDPLPQLAAYSTNAVVLAAYARWISDDGADLREEMQRAAARLRDYWARDE